MCWGNRNSEYTNPCCHEAISLNLVSAKLYCFRVRVHCYYCLYVIFSANPNLVPRVSHLTAPWGDRGDRLRGR